MDYKKVNKQLKKNLFLMNQLRITFERKWTIQEKLDFNRKIINAF